MSAPPSQMGETVTDKRQLVEYLEAGCKPAEQWRIGTEHEKFTYTVEDRKPLPYERTDGRSVRALLEGFGALGWEIVREDGKPIALTHEGCNITLEPGGQLELSGAPLKTLHQTCHEVNTHLAQTKQVAEPLGIRLFGMGFAPDWTRQEMPWMPKGRYAIMGAYMPKRGNLGLDMMLRTCTVQTNLDFADEADMVAKFRVSLALQPVATALFANSPFTEGRPNGYLSYRSHIWTDTDPDRTGVLPFVFDDGMGFERYVDYVLDVPMYFVYRDGRYIDASGQSFRDFMDGRLPALPGEAPAMSDWADHLTTLFPEVRLKRFLEMRGADGGPWRSLCALPALWVGLLYDGGALDAAWDLVKDWTIEDHERLRREVPKIGLKASTPRGSMRDLAMEVLKIADGGLKNRALVDFVGDDESHFLSALWEVAESGRTPAEEKLELFHGPWKGSTEPLYEMFAY